MLSVLSTTSGGTTPAASSPVPTAASSWIALLQDESVELRTAALQKLLPHVDVVWPLLADSLVDLEGAAADEALPTDLQRMSAAVASRVLFHLEEPVQALRLALQAGEQYFNPLQSSNESLKSDDPYVERLVAAALDSYLAVSRREAEGVTNKVFEGEDDSIPMAQLQPLVHRLLERTCANKHFHDALGLCWDAQEIEPLRKVLQQSQNDPALLRYTVTDLVSSNKSFRQQALSAVAECWKQVTPIQSAAYDLVMVYQLLQEAEPVSDILSQLLRNSDTKSYLLGLQLCFDLVDSGDQAFCSAVAKPLQLTLPSPAVGQEAPDTPLTKGLRILSGGFVSELVLSFLYQHNHADRLIMDTLKQSLEDRSSGSRSSVLHHAAVVTHSVLYAGTTNDSFLRQYLDWMKKASNW